MIIGIDVGGTNFRIGAVDENLNIVNFQKKDVYSVFDSQNPLGSLYEFLKEYIANIQIKVDAISIGFPATINKQRTKVLQAPNLTFIEDLDVVNYLESKLETPVFLEKDTTMLMYYDIHKYKVDTNGIISCIYFGTGVGSMLMINNRLVIGRNGTAGEIGHLCIEGNSLRCGCGNIGCDETLVGGHYLKKLIENKYKDTEIVDIFTKHKDDEELKLYVERMSIIIADVENILDPNCVLLGGGVLSLNDFPKSFLMKRIIEHTRKPYPANNLNIIFTDEDEDKGVIGATLFARSKLTNS